MRALSLVRSLPDHSLIDRLVRGRAWIPVLGVLLAGLVTMQVEILKLGTRVGRSIERSTALQSQNELLQAGVAGLADDQRIERLAAGMGMVMPAPGEMVFLPARAGTQVRRALGNLHAPDPAGFAAQLAALLAANAATAPAPQTSASNSSTSSAGGSASVGAASSGSLSAATPAAPTVPATSSPSATPTSQPSLTPQSAPAPAPQAGAATPSPSGAAAPAPPATNGG